jgi:hypothetical protein
MIALIVFSEFVGFAWPGHASACADQRILAWVGEPSSNSMVKRVADHIELGRAYKHFYFCDPSQVNIEVMVAT